MTFIKQNLFLVILAAVTLAGGGALLLLAHSGDLDDELAARAQVSDDLDAARKQGKLYTREFIEAQTNAAETDANNVAKARRDMVDLNRRNFQVLKLKPVGKSVDIPAFPFNAQQYDENALYFPFTKTYREEIRNLRESLKPTAAPTQADIEAQAAMFAPPSERAAGERDASPGRSFSEETRRQALEYLRMNNARKGCVYVEDDAFTVVFPEPVGTAQPDKLWAAMLSLWIQGDIVAAIRQTNDELLAKRGVRDPGVPDSAVKHLVNIRVGGYAGTTSKFTESPSAEPAGEAGDLTQAGCTKEYDLVAYNFTVVMTAEHLLALQQNLMRRNLHTIVKVEMTAPQTKPITPGATAGAAIAGDACYYGPEAVFEVKLYGQLLLLTDWERGLWDAQEKRWMQDFPPLMPKETLSTLPQAALRPEDAERLRGGKD